MNVSLTYPSAGAQAAPLVAAADGTLAVAFAATPGLYQLSVIFDATDFAWDSLYIDLHAFNNDGRRTGPWDFSPIDGNRPVVPAWRATLDGRHLGMWFCQRITPSDLRQQRFRGRMAFEVTSAGEHRLQLVPFRRCNVRWESARLDRDIEDQLRPPAGLRPATGNIAARRWADPAFWAARRQELRTSHQLYAAPLQRLFGNLEDAPPQAAAADVRAVSQQVIDVPRLLAAYYCQQQQPALDTVRRVIDAFCQCPHWGNPNPDGYSHDGDMAAMFPLRILAWALHALGPELPAEQRRRVIEKLRLQGTAFFDQLLLNRDYWGGSLQQDHGWQSVFGFGTAALHLYGVIPEAAHWLALVLPRVDRMIAAAPRDGAVPAASHFRLDLWLDEVCRFRDAYLDLGGPDILLRTPFPEAIDFLCATLDVTRRCYITGGHGDHHCANGGVAALNRLAAALGDGRAAWLARFHLETPAEVHHATQATADSEAVLWGFLSHDPAVEPVAPERPATALHHWADSGLVHLQSAAGATLALRCGPSFGYHSAHASSCPCDGLGGPPTAGHFTLAINGEPLLITPDPGYALHTALGSVLLIDDRGQRDDIGYPMSIPAQPYHGARIETVNWDAETATGVILLDLTPAYGPELGVLRYAREFSAGPTPALRLRDHLVLTGPRRLAWLFQSTPETPPALAELTATFGAGSQLHLTPRPPEGITLTASVRDTDVVYAYSSPYGFKPFSHVRYETAAKHQAVLVSFDFTW